MKCYKFRKFFLIILIKLVIFAIIHQLYTLRQYLHNECSKNSAVIIRKSFSDIPREYLTNQTIYFLETHNSSEHELTARQACAIESAAYMNPNTKIFVLFLSPSNHIKLKNWSQFREILEYKNVHLRFFHLRDIIKDTIVEKWINSSAVQKSKWKVLHLSDTLRYALLYKYSGYYFDLDVIVRKPLSEINLSNFACLEEEREQKESINNAILSLNNDEVGRKVGEMLLT